MPTEEVAFTFIFYSLTKSQVKWWCILSNYYYVSPQKFYEQRIPIRIYQSSQRILLLCRGQGLEPRLEFDRNLVEFGPILPHSSGDEQEIIVKNPSSFPIEFYNLEFDSSYLEEEKVWGV